MDEIIVKNGEEVIIKPEVVDCIINIESEVKRLKEEEEKLKEKILKSMEKKGILKVENDALSINYIASTKTERLDTKALKKELPDIYDEYVKLSNRKSYVKIEVKK